MQRWPFGKEKKNKKEGMEVEHFSLYTSKLTNRLSNIRPDCKDCYKEKMAHFNYLHLSCNTPGFSRILKEYGSVS